VVNFARRGIIVVADCEDCFWSVLKCDHTRNSDIGVVSVDLLGTPIMIRTRVLLISSLIGEGCKSVSVLEQR